MSKQAHNLFDKFPKTILGYLNSPASSLFQTQQAHAHILKTALFFDTYTTTKLLSLYANHLRFNDAQLVLNSLPNPDISSFSTLIYASSKFSRFGEALNLFSKMVSTGLVPDARVVPCVVKACSGLLVVRIGQQVHGLAASFGLASDSFVVSSLVHFYVKCGQLGNARKLLDTMREPDVVSWSALLAGYARQGNVWETKVVFDMMVKAGIEFNSVSWNGVIAGFNQSGHHLEAVLALRDMHARGFELDGTSVSSGLSAVGDLENLLFGIQVHDYVIKQGLGSDRCIISALIDMYGKCSCTFEMSRVFDEMSNIDLGACNALITGFSRSGLVDEALSVFKKFKGLGMELNVVTWTSMIASCSQHGKDIEALELFREMQTVGVKPNAVTIPCLLPACGNIAALMHGKAIHGFSLRRGISSDVYVGSALIDMYANCGRIQAARRCFDGMPKPNLVCWNALMGGYAMHGKAKEVIDIFHLMQNAEQNPDFISFTSLLSACSHSGLTEEGEFYFGKMSKEYGIEARVEHYACIVTLLGRAGKLEEAYSIIKKMPFKPDACVWGALLSSCRVHHKTKLAEIAANELFELEPNNPGNYILLSNIYAAKSKWREVYKLRDKMKCMGLRKNPGCSWIEIKNRVYMLLAGDNSIPQMDQIVDKLDRLSGEMKKSGYAPITDFVLQDVEDQEKEHILCGHSEKLAVVFGLLNTLPGTPLQIIKNLRICGDCHAVIKFISSYEGREIFVRDTKRFHHFKDGVCSCGDYW
ncbi:hypothetical protein DCAR_0417090 [Daucus carota subsp. sativus]|nr:hypothetical protein DCAR_0417090 [Daucus carota subsp. sativus]